MTGIIQDIFIQAGVKAATVTGQFLVVYYPNESCVDFFDLHAIVGFTDEAIKRQKDRDQAFEDNFIYFISAKELLAADYGRMIKELDVQGVTLEIWRFGQNVTSNFILPEPL